MRPIPAVRAVQRRLGELQRDRVAGADAGERGQQIWGKPGVRWFSPGDPIWSVHEDAAMFPGGVAALLGRLATATVRWGLAGVESGRRSAPPPAEDL